MRFLFYHSSMQSGGAERNISLLSDYLTAQGDEVTIVTMDGRPPFYTLRLGVRHIALNTARTSKGKIDAIKNCFLAMQAVRRTFLAVRPDVVVCFQPNTLLFSWLVRGSMNYRIIGSERANPYLWTDGFWNKAKQYISLCADGYIFQTAGAQSYYPEKTKAKSIVLGNMLQPEVFETAEIPWGERNNICAVGRMSEEKRFDDLLRAVAIVLKKHPNICLDLYGDGPLRKHLEDLCTELGIEGAVRFCGRNNQINNEYAKHKIFVMTSESEGMPNVLMEAMASGCACVSTNCDFGPSELIKDGENGLLVPVHDVNAIADHICRLLEDDAIGERMGEAARSILKSNAVNKIGAEFYDYVANIK